MEEFEVVSQCSPNVALRRLNDEMQNLMGHFQPEDRKAKWQLFVDARNENSRLRCVVNQKQDQVRALQYQLREAEKQRSTTAKQVKMNELAIKRLEETCGFLVHSKFSFVLVLSFVDYARRSS